MSTYQAHKSRCQNYHSEHTEKAKPFGTFGKAKCFQLLRNRKGQAAIEFIVLLVILFSVFMVYTISTRTKIDEIREKKEIILLDDVVRMSQQEILLAIKVEDGYHRVFELPESLEGINYTIGITGTAILANTEKHESAVIIPLVNGTLKKGENIITKENGVVKIE